MGNWHIVLVHSVSIQVKSSLGTPGIVWSALSILHHSTIQYGIYAVLCSHDPSLMAFATTSSPCSIIIQLFYTTHKTTRAICNNSNGNYNKCQLCKANQDNLVNGYNCLGRFRSVALMFRLGNFVFICAANNKNVIKDAMQSAISIVQGMRIS